MSTIVWVLHVFMFGGMYSGSTTIELTFQTEAQCEAALKTVMVDSKKLTPPDKIECQPRKAK